MVVQERDAVDAAFVNQGLTKPLGQSVWHALGQGPKTLMCIGRCWACPLNHLP